MCLFVSKFSETKELKDGDPIASATPFSIWQINSVNKLGNNANSDQATPLNKKFIFNKELA